MRRASTLLFVCPVLFAFGCAEVPRCEERGPTGRERIEVVCSADKVPVCGSDPALIYDSETGALLKVPPATVADGSCGGETRPCRPRPVCGNAGEEPTCATGETPHCVLGEVVTLMAPMTTPDAGPPPVDAGDVDAGDTDAGETDAGDVDAGDIDAGDTDAGDTDAA